MIAVFSCCHEVVFLLAASEHYVICQQLFSPLALQQWAASTLNMLEGFLRFDQVPEVETQMICVLTYRHQVCFAITQLPYNKREVLHGETDKHLDKLNKAFADCLGVFIFGSSNLMYKRARLFGVFAGDLWNWWKTLTIF